MKIYDDILRKLTETNNNLLNNNKDYTIMYIFEIFCSDNGIYLYKIGFTENTLRQRLIGINSEYKCNYKIKIIALFEIPKPKYEREFHKKAKCYIYKTKNHKELYPNSIKIYNIFIEYMNSFSTHNKFINEDYNINRKVLLYI